MGYGLYSNIFVNTFGTIFFVRAYVYNFLDLRLVYLLKRDVSKYLDLSMSEWEKLFESPVGYRVEMVRALLESNNIPAVVLNKKDSSYLFGHFEVYVYHEHMIQALIVMEQSNLE